MSRFMGLCFCCTLFMVGLTGCGGGGGSNEVTVSAPPTTPQLSEDDPNYHSAQPGQQ